MGFLRKRALKGFQNAQRENKFVQKKSQMVLLLENSQNLNLWVFFMKKILGFSRKSTLKCFKNGNCEKCFNSAHGMVILPKNSQNVQNFIFFWGKNGFFRKRDLNCFKIANRAEFFLASVTNGVIALRSPRIVIFWGFL